MMMIILICLLAAGALAIAVYALWPQSNTIHDRVAQLSGAQSDNARRIVIFEQMYDTKGKNEVQQLIQEAGWYDATPAKVAFWQISGLAIGAAIAAILIFGLKVEGVVKTFAFAPIALGYLAPKFLLNKAVKARKTAIQLELPDFLDMVSSTVAAGTALNGALTTAVDMCTGPLGDEFRATLADIRMGRSRSDALNSMATRVNQIDLRQMVTAITQSERVGGNISTVLEELAQESRERRLMRAEEIAGTLPIKMTIPMALLLLPSIFVVIFGPVVANMQL